MKQLGSLVLIGIVACGAPGASGGGGGTEPTASKTSKGEGFSADEKKKLERELHGERGRNKGFTREHEQGLAEVDKALLRVLRQASGKEDDNEKFKTTPTSALFPAIKAGNLKLAMKPAPDQEYAGFRIVDTDAFTASVKAIPPKDWATKKDALVKAQDSWTALNTRVLYVAQATLFANKMEQTLAIRTMLITSHMKGERQKLGLDFNDEDYKEIKNWLGEIKRAEMTAALAMGLNGAYVAAIEKGKDPKVIDQLGAKTESAIPAKIEATDAEAKAYVEKLDETTATARARYETWMRQAYGDEVFERQHKRWLDDVFAQAEAASKQGLDPSLQRVLDDRKKGGSAPEPAAKSGAKPGNDVSATLDTAAALFPADSSIQNSLQGISKLAKGDVKGALGAAIKLAPVPGPIKDGLNMVLGMFG